MGHAVHIPSCVGGFREGGVLRVSGVDASRFLNGMLTQKVEGLDPHALVASARADTKGRVSGLFDVWRVEEDTYYLASEGLPASFWAEEFERFVFLEDVRLEPLETWAVYTLQGRDVCRVMTTAGCAVPSEASVVYQGAVHVLCRPRSPLSGFDLVGPLPEVTRLVRALEGVEDDEEALERLRTLAGQVRWPVDMIGRTLPHELGLRETHLHFSKGCYVGQEIIHRLEVRGGIRRQVVTVLASDGIASGDVLLSGVDKVGVMLSHVPVLGDARLGLAQVKVELARPDAAWVTAAGHTVKVVGCPHASS